ncbi:MAG: glutathione S-transferase family protein [Proteobacteria bacterium]|nr:glutathione S-transferase family protein [Pseudomonadota bacterium]
MPTLSYFDFPGGRGEDCRIALHLAGVPFTDDRIKGPEWPERKPTTPFGSLPTLELEGRGVIGQSNAILAYIGRSHGLLPSDLWESARHEAMLGSVEDLRALVNATFGMAEEAKQAARTKLAGGKIPEWASRIEPQITGPFIGGDAISVADLKLFVVMNWFTAGVLDHIPADVFAPFERLSAHHAAVAAHPGVQSWYAK